MQRNYVGDGSRDSPIARRNFARSGRPATLQHLMGSLVKKRRKRMRKKKHRKMLRKTRYQRRNK